MKMKRYYIKYKNMYVRTICVDEDFPQNEFIQYIQLDMNNDLAKSYKYEVAMELRAKLDSIGFDLDRTSLEEEETEDGNS